MIQVVSLSWSAEPVREKFKLRQKSLLPILAVTPFDKVQFFKETILLDVVVFVIVLVVEVVEEVVKELDVEVIFVVIEVLVVVFTFWVSVLNSSLPYWIVNFVGWCSTAFSSNFVFRLAVFSF